MKATIGDKELNFPDNLKYSKQHQWWDADKKAVGITDYAQSQLGDIVMCDLVDAEGLELSAGDLIEDIAVEAQKAVADIYSPVNGSVASINQDLEDEPEKINEDPYGEGWLFKFDGATPADDLLDAAAYVEYIKSL
ncbi:MAG: glycine cleavage system protein GcvH [Candidatus Lokiarchaeota archaeon]|nr:glycine cleavage system protein GcvH [Candidatus Lokiarchaeota archaeon]